MIENKEERKKKALIVLIYNLWVSVGITLVIFLFNTGSFFSIENLPYYIVLLLSLYAGLISFLEYRRFSR